MFNILELRAQGLSIREVARRTGHDRKTVRKWLRQREIPRYGPRPPVSGKLEPYKPYLQARIAVGVWNANRLLEELRAQAFQSVHQAPLHLPAVPLIKVIAAQLAVGFPPLQQVVDDDQQGVGHGEGGRRQDHLAVSVRLAAARVAGAFQVTVLCSHVCNGYLQRASQRGGKT